MGSTQPLLPRVLVLHLKRFEYQADARVGRFVKRTSPVDVTRALQACIEAAYTAYPLPECMPGIPLKPMATSVLFP